MSLPAIFRRENFCDIILSSQSTFHNGSAEPLQTKGLEIMIVNETIRPDGLKIVTGYLPESKRVHIRFVCNRGSADDPIGKHGTAHLFEHLVFRGTKRRTAEDVNLFLKRRALRYGAMTALASVTYHLEGVVRRAEELFDFFADLYFQSSFSDADLRDERQLVLREADKNLQNEYRCAGGFIRRTLYQNGPLAWVGDAEEKEQVVSITRDDLLTARREWHTPSNTVLLGVGGISHHEFCRLASGLISLHAEHAHRPALVHDDEYDLLPRESRLAMPWPNRRLVSTFYVCKYPRFRADRDFILQRYVEEIFVNGAGSRLWNKARTAQPLGYQLGGSIDGGHATGYTFSSYINSKPDDALVSSEALQECMTKPLGEIDVLLFEGVREYLLDDYESDHEGNLRGWAGLLQRYIAQGNPRRAEGYRERMREIVADVSMDEIEGVRARVFRPERMVTMVIEPEG